VRASPLAEVARRRARALVPRFDGSGRLATAAVVDSLGTGLYLAGSAVAFTRFVGLSAAQLGFGLLLGGMVSLLTAVPWGLLVDRVGARRVLVILSLWRAAGFAAYALVHGFRGFVAVACLLGVADRAVAPATQALVGAVVPPNEQVPTMAGLRALRNCAFGISGLLAGLALQLDTRLVFDAIMLGNAASFVAVAALVGRIPVRRAPRPRRTARAKIRLALDRPLLALTGLNAVLSLHMTLLGVGIPLLIAEQTRLPLGVLGPLLTLNTVLAVLCQVRVSRGATGAYGSASCLRRGGLALAGSCALLAVAGGVPPVFALGLVAAGMVALTAGELLHSAGAWGLSFALVPEGSHGSYLSFFNLGVTVQLIAGPIVVAAVLAAGRAGWLGLGLVVAAAGVATPPAARWAARCASDVASSARPALGGIAQ
jgi:MFS family permease